MVKRRNEMFRDFSATAKQQLLQYVDDVNSNDTWDGINDFFGRYGADKKWFEKLDITSYVDNVNTYHQKIIDKKNTSAQQIEQIFSDVEAVDTRYMSGVSELVTYGNKIVQLVNDLADMIDPNGGNLSTEKMNSILAADVEAMQNAEATVEKTIEDENLGMNPDAAQMSADPVNLSTGNFVYDHEDLKIGGEIPLSFHRYYNSKDSRIGVLGKCFLHNYELKIEEALDGKIGLRLSDGQMHHYEKTPEGTYVGQKIADGELEKTEEGYRILYRGNEQLIFDQDGKIIRKEALTGRGISFTYDEKDRLTEAKTDNGSVLSYQYDEKSGYLNKVTDHVGRTVIISYQNGILSKVMTASGAVYTYNYGTNGRITDVVNARKVVSVKNQYDKKYRILRQEFPDGGTMEFQYEDANRRVTMIERNGSKTVYVHDDRYRNTETIYEDGTKEKYFYNDRNQCISMTDRNGHTKRMAYDNRGNLTQSVDALKRRMNMTYDADNHLLNISINGKERLKNHYDAKGNLIGTENIHGNGIQIFNDSFGRPTEINYADGSKVTLGYDERGNVTSFTDAFGALTVYAYDELNRIIATKDANEGENKYQYDQSDRITCVTNAEGNQREYTYNAGGKVTRLKDYDGNSIQMSYNEIGKPQEYIDKEGHVVNFSYDKMWNLAQQIAPDGGVHRFLYDADNRLEQVTLPMGGELTYTYDAVGNRTSVTDAEGNITAFTYDAADRLNTVIEPDGAMTAYQYDTEGNLTKVTDAMGHVTAYTYDELGRRTSVTDALGNTTSVFYDCMGNVERICYPNGSERVFTYEAGARLKSVTNPDGSGESYTYDKKGNLISRANTLGEKISMSYDCMNRVTSITNQAGGIRHFQYDAVGNVIGILDEKGNQTTYHYSPNGNLIQVTDALGNDTFYEYDSMGHLTKTTCTGRNGEAPQDTTYFWNLAGQVAGVIDPLGDQENYLYDKNGRMVSKKDKDGYETSFGYSATGQMEEILYADGRKVSMSYNALKQLTEMQDWLGTTHMELDALGRPLSVTDPYGKEVSYEWGSMGEKLALTYPDGKKAAYEYNQAMQLTAMYTGSATELSNSITYHYDEAGRLKEKMLPNGITTSYEYQSLGRLEAIHHHGEQVNELYQFQYDELGNKVSTRKERNQVVEDSGKFDYGYDALNRLIQVKKDGDLLRSYSYDAFGNRLSKEDWSNGACQLTTYQYNVKNQLITEADQQLEKEYNYDHRGNLLSVRTGKELLKQFQFDAANQMERSMGFVNGTMKQATYQYNGLGQRMNQTVWNGQDLQPDRPEHKIQYTLDLTRQYHNMLTKQERYVGTEQPSSVSESIIQNFYWDGNVTSMESNGQKNFYLQDDLGSPMNLLNQEGFTEESYSYDEFGVPQSYAKTQPFGFTGYQMDEAGGLYFAQARRYDAAAGRFVSEDKVKGFVAVPFTLNHYGYCWNRPMNLVDLNGRYPNAGVSQVLYDNSILSNQTISEDEQNKICETEFQYDYDGFDSTSMMYAYTAGGAKITTVATCNIAESAVMSSARPNNYNIGTWGKMLSDKTDDIAKFSDTVAGRSLAGQSAKTGILDRAAYFGVILDAGSGIHQNIQSGAEIDKTLTDAVVDVAVSGTSIWASGALGAEVGTAVGTVFPVVGNLVGAIAGFIIGIILYAITDVVKINGKSIRDWAKVGAENIVYYIENLFEGGSEGCLD